MAEVNHYILPEGKAVYFASDMHFGTPSREDSSAREHRFVQWLESIAQDAHALYLVGDVFDFWMEYRHVVPKGHIRVLGALAKLADAGVEIHYFTGNHDMWIRDYFEQELGAKVYRKPVYHRWDDCTMYIGHGDGLGPGDWGYKFLKRVFNFKPFQWAFRMAPVDFAFFIAQTWSRDSRKRTGAEDYKQKPLSQEPMFLHAQKIHRVQPADIYIFGHRHFPQDSTQGTVRFVNLGDWLQYDSWAVFKADGFNLKTKS